MHALAQWLLLILVIFLLIKLLPLLLAIGAIFMAVATVGLLLFIWQLWQARRQFEQAQEAFLHHQHASRSVQDDSPVIHVEAEIMPEDEKHQT